MSFYLEYTIYNYFVFTKSFTVKTLANLNLTDNDDGRRNESSNEEKENESSDDDSQTFDQIHVSDFYSFGGTNSENDRNSEKN